jgi:hypothetical protein
LCVSTNAIEHHAINIYEDMSNQTKYKIIKVNFVGSEIPINDPDTDALDRLPMISSVILEDSDGIHYMIEPNETGLTFAKGEITYTEYLRIKQKAGRQMMGIFCGSIALFLIMSLALFKFFF